MVCVPYFLERDFENNRLLVAKKGHEAELIKKFNFQQNLVRNYYVGNHKFENASIHVYDKRYEQMKMRERLNISDFEQEEKDYWIRIEYKFRDKADVNEVLTKFGYKSPEFRLKIQKEKDDIIRFVPISPNLSLENKRKSKKTANFWREFTSWLLDEEKLIIIDKGEGLEEHEIVKSFREIEERKLL